MSKFSAGDRVRYRGLPAVVLAFNPEISHLHGPYTIRYDPDDYHKWFAKEEELTKARSVWYKVR